MTTHNTDELPLFPATAPSIFRDPEATKALFEPVFAQLADVVRIDPVALGQSTPCDGFTVDELRNHVLGWLQFFAAALNDPTGASERLDPSSWELDADQDPGALVEQASADIATAIDAGVAEHTVVMSQARMTGDCVLAMALGEYLVHGWDLAMSTARTWSADESASEVALAFLQATVAPEYRGPDSGFFDAEVTAPDGAGAFERLLCFGGRDPRWAPA